MSAYHLKNYVSVDLLHIINTYFYTKATMAKHYPAIARLRQTSISKDNDVADSISFYADGLTESLMLYFLPLIEEKYKVKLYPTYSYFRIYSKNSFLIPHLDRPQCEYSISMPVGFSNECLHSDIWICNQQVGSKKHTFHSFDDVEFKNSIESNATMYRQEFGDLLLYEGTKYFHWRYPIENEMLAQAFLHYSTNKEDYLDKRKDIGMPVSENNEVIVYCN